MLTITILQFDSYSCGRAITNSELMNTVIELLNIGSKNAPWLAPLLLLIDLHERIAQSVSRKNKMKFVTVKD